MASYGAIDHLTTGTSMGEMKRVGLLSILVLTSCATVEYELPRPTEGALERAEARLIEEAYTTAVSRRARVYDLSWPVLTQNAALCPDVVPSFGVVLADREQHARLAGGIRVDDVAEQGVPDKLHLYHVHRGSPADYAGLRAGDILLRVNDHSVEALSKAAKHIRSALEDGPLTLTIQREGVTKDVTLGGIDRCAMSVKIAQSDAINASAGTGDIVIYQGLIRVLSDDALQFVIAHEAAHLAVHHPRKYTRNFIVSGGIVSGPLLYTAAWMGDKAAGMVGHRPEISFRRRAVHQTVPWTAAFEAEADYLGAYFHVRAGGDLKKAVETFTVFGREAPTSIYARATHPLVPERIEALALTMDEIEAKQKAGLPLVPNARKP